MFCPQCGTKLAEGVRFCYRCGCRLADFIPDLEEEAPRGEAAPAEEEPQPAPAAPAVEPPPAEAEAATVAPVEPEAEEPPPDVAEVSAVTAAVPLREPPPTIPEVPTAKPVEPVEERPPAEEEAPRAASAEPRVEPVPAEAPHPAEQAPPPTHVPVILVDESHKERTNQQGWAEFLTRLKERGKVSVRDKKPLTKALLRGKDVLVVGGPEHPWVIGRGADRWSEDEIAATEQFVRQGGGLLVLGDGLASAETVSALTAPFGITFSRDDVGDVVAGADEISSHPLTARVSSLRLGSVGGIGGLYLQVQDPAVAVARYQGRPVLAYCAHQQGQVVVLSSLAAFSDKFIDRADNAVLLDNILRQLSGPGPVEPERSTEVKSAEKAQPKRAAVATEAGAAGEELESPHPATGLAARLARARERAAPLQETLAARAKEVAASVQEAVSTTIEEVGEPAAQSLAARAREVAESVQDTVAAKAKEMAGPDEESLVTRAKGAAASVQDAVAAKAREAAAVAREAMAPEAEQPPAPAEGTAPGQAQPRHAPGEVELWVNLFGDEDTAVHFDFAEHLQNFRQGLPPLAWEEGALDFVRGLCKPEDDPWTCDLPFTSPEPWSAVNYLRRVLYHLTQGRISYFIDAETKQRRGGYYRMATIPAVANMNQQRFEVRHPITLTEEPFLGEWPGAMSLHFGAVAGGIYLTPYRFLIAADQSWLAGDEDRRVPLPFLSFWAKVDFRAVLRVLGAEGVPMLVERQGTPVPKRLARRMWFEPVESWQAQGNLEIMAITGWEMELTLVEGRRGGDGIREPSPDQAWAFFGYRVTKPQGRPEFVAMVPPLILPGNKQVLKGIQGDFQFLRSKHATADALELIALARVARDNGLRHSPDLVSWPIPLQDGPYTI